MHILLLPWLLMALAFHAEAFSQYRDLIPNGHNVPDPCNPAVIWKGVGHQSPQGGNARNPFGLDFKANGFKWNRTLCEKDSDNDGKTNGQELGDPDCIWTKGATPARTSGLSHPGVCDPLGGSCAKQNTFLSCEGFVCPAIDEPGVVKKDIRLPETAVPNKETTYICMNFELSVDQPHHIVAHTPIIANENVLHHILAYECHVENAGELTNELNQPYDCLMAPEEKCRQLFGLWAFGVKGSCAHENAGILVGGTKGLRYASIQLHWNNPEMRSDFKDSSGMSFYMTPSLRPNNAGVLMVGKQGFAIPPNREAHVVTGSCQPMCTKEIQNQIYVFEVNNHMHSLGRAQITELLRNGDRVNMLALDEVYDYNSPASHNHRDAVMVKPNDEIKTTCVFTSLNHNRTTFFGQGTSDEMCFSFLIYYPKENMPMTACTEWNDIASCDWEDNVINGCNITKYSSPTDPENAAHIAKVFDYCRTTMCTEECKNYMRVKKREPCFHGGVYASLKRFVNNIPDPQMKSDAFNYYMLMQSCDEQLALESVGFQATGSAHTTCPMVCGILIMLTIAISLFSL